LLFCFCRFSFSRRQIKIDFGGLGFGLAFLCTYSFFFILGKYLAYEISLFLARVENVSLISIQVMAIISHQIDFSFIYVSCLVFLQDAIRSECLALAAFGRSAAYIFMTSQGAWHSSCQEIGCRPSAMKFYLCPLKSGYFSLVLQSFN